MTAFRKMFTNKANTARTSTLTIIFILNYFFGCCTPQLYEGSYCKLKDGSLAVCKSFTLCRWAIQGMTHKTLSYNDLVRCSFEGNTEIICCGDERPTLSERPTQTENFPDDDTIYFDSATSRSLKITTKQPLTTTTKRITSTRTTLAPISSIQTTTQPVRTTTRLVVTTMRPVITTTRPAITTTRPITTTTRPITTTMRPVITTTSSSQLNRSKTTTKSGTKPTVHPFWETWTPTRNVPTQSSNSSKIVMTGMVGASNDDDVEIFTIPTQISNSSKLVMAPWLQELLNEAIAGNNVSATTQNGDGFNNIENKNNTESNNDLPDSRQKTTLPSVTPPTSGTTSFGTSTSPPSRLGPKRKSEIACENYTSLSSPFLNFNIYGGIPTALGEFPHMAALGYLSEEIGGNQYDFNCGGSIISENYILTAAHCVSRTTQPEIIRSGKITLLTNEDDAPGVNSNVAQIIIHPNYQPSRNYDDIALIRVSSPIPFGENVRPACLRSNMSDIDPSVVLFVTGWGSVEGGTRSNVLLKTNLTGVTLESCNSSLLGYEANNRRLRNGVNLGQICAFDPQGRNDACQGDSGGPMQTYSPNGMSTIVGVTSFGITCGSALPSVYTRVAFYLDWIESIVWPN